VEGAQSNGHGSTANTSAGWPVRLIGAMAAMTHPSPTFATLDDWVAREAVPFSVDAAASFHTAVERVVAALGDPVELLGFGEPLHGGTDFLLLRNRLVRELVGAHGYTAIAVESSFPRARAVNEFVAGRGPAAYEDVRDAGFSHGFGQLGANQELVEWMRGYNADSAHRLKLSFYGFDSPTEMTGTDSPRQVLSFALDYLAAADGARADEYRRRIDALIGRDADWEDPAAMTDPSKAVGRSPAATALRVVTEDLVTELCLRRPELVAATDEGQYREAAQHLAVARWLLNYHAALAGTSDSRLVELLGIRDAAMADNLVYTVARERGRGKVLAFAHNSHLKRGRALWQLGPNALAWWPAGAHLAGMLGPRYAVIGSALGNSDADGVGPPERGTLEARLTAGPGPALFIPTHRGRGLPAAEVAALPTRSGSAKNPTYFPLSPQSLTDFDWLAVLHSAG
jgi:erythromycin esterase-like protein